MSLQGCCTIKECISSFCSKVTIHIKGSLEQTAQIKVLIANTEAQTACPAREVLTDNLTVTIQCNLTVTVQVLILDISQFFCSQTFRTVLQIFLCIEESVSNQSVIRTDRITFQIPDLIIATRTFCSTHVGNFILYVAYIQSNVIAPVFTNIIIVEQVQVETCIFYTTGILCRSTHTDNALNRQIQQHVIGFLLVHSQFKA